MGKKKRKDFNRILKNNFKPHIHYEHDYYHACESGSDCCDGDYCRCGTVVNSCVPVNVTNAYRIALMVAKNKGLCKDFRFYCLERMINCLLRGNTECFCVSTCAGYYGEEISGIELDWNILNQINYFVDELGKRKTQTHYRSLVEQILTIEYDYVLPHLMNRKWQYEKILIKNIKPGNDSYRNINGECVAQYAQDNAWPEPLSCLCKKVDNNFILVDGYHRYTAALKNKDKYMMVMWYEI